MHSRHSSAKNQHQDGLGLHPSPGEAPQPTLHQTAVCHHEDALHLVGRTTASSTPASSPPSTRLPSDGVCAHTQHGGDKENKGKGRHIHNILQASTTTCAHATASEKNSCHLHRHQTCALPLCFHGNLWDRWPLPTAHSACSPGNSTDCWPLQTIRNTCQSGNPTDCWPLQTILNTCQSGNPTGGMSTSVSSSHSALSCLLVQSYDLQA